MDTHDTTALATTSGDTTTTPAYEPQPADAFEHGPDGANGLQARHWLIIAVCALYFFSPVDFAPELVLGPLGLPDDIIAVVAAVGVVVTRLGTRNRPVS